MFVAPPGTAWPLYLKRPPSVLPTEWIRKSNMSLALRQTLDRTNVLGDNETYGHTGCVNAVSWAQDGDLLLTGGDDTTVRIWRMDASQSKQEYPYTCRSVISTGHRANIFNVQMLPYSTRIITAAGDKQIRVFDAETALDAARDGVETEYSARQCCLRIIRCHEGRVKKLVTEDSPDLFLSLSEDGTVRQHDLRTSHSCQDGTCPAPLMKTNHELSTLSLSTLTPYQFVVAGESPYGYLYDRRHIGRVLENEWGSVPRMGKGVTTCVRRFGRSSKASGSKRRDHVTGARMSSSNGHELLMSYSSDKIYLFSTHDDPHAADSLASMLPSVLAPNTTIVPSARSTILHEDCVLSPGHRGTDSANAQSRTGDQTEDEDEGEEIEALIDFDDFGESDQSNFMSDIPTILPRNLYAGARNVATIKDVNFLGPHDEWVVSGSDDGNFFMWDKVKGKLHAIYDGDNSVVNVVEGHPHLPIVAVSGIDTTVKHSIHTQLFSPVVGKSAFSRFDNAENIVETNARLSRTRIIRYNFSSLLAEARAAMGTEGTGIPECPSQ